jgi:tetratricopeptide (TPR) repeat protein
LVNAGKTKIAAGNLDAANADFTRALTLDPNNGPAFCGRGDIQTVKNEFNQAVIEYGHAIDLKPPYAAAYLKRGIARYAFSLDPRLDAPNTRTMLDSAMVDFAFALDADRKDPLVHLYIANGFNRLHHYPQAIEEYDQVIALQPTSVVAVYNRGIAKKLSGDLDGAIADFDQTLKLNSKAAIALASRGTAKQLKGDFDGAIADFTSAIDLNPKDQSTTTTRAAARLYDSRLNRPFIDFDHHVDFYPAFSNIFLDSANAKFGKGDTAGALTDFDRALSLDPENFLGNYYRGFAREANGDDAGAQEDFILADKLPRHPK